MTIHSEKRGPCGVNNKIAQSKSGKTQEDG